LGHSLSLFDLVIIQVQFYVYAPAALDCYPPTYASCIAELTSSHHYALMVEMGGLMNFLPGLVLHLHPPNLCLMSI
jgi:hypothetical protein